MYTFLFDHRFLFFFTELLTEEVAKRQLSDTTF